MAKSNLIVAAGGLLFRDNDGEPEYAIVRTVKNGAWGLPKGRMKATDQSLLETALREVQEETGCLVDPLGYAGDYRYAVSDGTKVVLIWHMEVVRENWRKLHPDVGRLRWVSLPQAIELLDRPEERDFLSRLRSFDRSSKFNSKTERAIPSLISERFSPFHEWDTADAWSR